MTPRRPTRAARTRLLAGGLAAALLSACASSANSDQTSGAKPSKVTLAVPAPSELFHLPVILADQLGYYADEGLDVTIVDVGAGTNAVQSLLSGDAQAASGFVGNAITMAAKGQALRSFVTTMTSPGAVLAVSPATGRFITKIADLKGSVVGVSAPGAAPHMFLNYLLHQHGMSPDDVSVAGVGIGATAVAAMEHGKVDAAVLGDPAISQLERRVGDVKLLVDTRSRTGMVDVFGTEEAFAMTLYARSNWLAENKDTARRLVAAVIRACRWARQHEAREIAKVMPADYAGDDLALYTSTIATAAPAISPDGRIHADAVAVVRKLLAVSLPEVADADFDLADVFTNEFL